MRVIDLFAGCGGMTRGFSDASFEVVGAVENDLAAAATYAANFGESHVYFGDIVSYVENGEIPEADVVIGGPPCQGFSNLGKRDPADSRNKLWERFIEVVIASHAKVWVLENVDRFQKSIEYTRLRAEMLEGGRLQDFDHQAYILNAADFGTPQRRKRSIVVGSKIGPVGDPEPTHGQSPGPGDELEPWTTVRTAIADLTARKPIPELPNRTESFFGDDLPGVFKLDDIHLERRYQKKSIERYDHIAPGRSRFDLPEELMYECWKRHRTGSADVLGRLEWDKPAVTIRTEFFKPEKGRYLHPAWTRKGHRGNVNRALTHAEAALLQGFDERHLWCGSRLEIARQIGNAVPPPLAEAIANKVAERLSAS